jgi:hypothetical protein
MLHYIFFIFLACLQFCGEIALVMKRLFVAIYSNKKYSRLCWLSQWQDIFPVLANGCVKLFDRAKNGFLLADTNASEHGKQ